MSRLKELRKEKGYTQIKMQLLTGIDQSDYSKIENGKRYLTHEQCRRLAIALDTSMDYLAGLTDEKSLIPEARPRKIRDRRRLTAGGLKGEEGLRKNGYCSDRSAHLLRRPYKNVQEGSIRPIAKRLEWPDAVTVLPKAEQ